MNTTTELLDCGHPASEHSSITTGYGIDAQGRKHCYACCAEQDKIQMRKTGKICLYLTTKPDKYESPAGLFRTGSGAYGDAKITNWPGSLELRGRYAKGRHNIAGSRYDVWFTFEGASWHGVTYGENTQICHCRRLKQ